MFKGDLVKMLAAREKNLAERAKMLTNKSKMQLHFFLIHPKFLYCPKV